MLVGFAASWMRLWWLLLFLCIATSTRVALATPDEEQPICSNSSQDGVCTSQVTPEEEDESSASSISSIPGCPSQTELALEMARLSSPRAHAKLRHILTAYTEFYVDLGGTQKVFDTVALNLLEALEGFGLQQTNSTDREGVLRVETFFSGNRKARDLETKGILFLQTEQICCSRYGQIGLPYLQKCHESPNCLVWEYSETNWQFLKEKQLGDSVLLVPFLHQQRLNTYYPADIPRLGHRPIDVVFFGVMTPRRREVRQQLTDLVEKHGLKWNLLLEEVGMSGDNLDFMASKYLESKICLIIHGFGDNTPGEYHRLSELVGSGCLPIVETFGDQVGMDAYRTCGGVIFANLHLIPTIIMQALNTISPQESFQIDRRLQWWSEQVRWDQLLDLILKENMEAGTIQLGGAQQSYEEG